MEEKVEEKVEEKEEVALRGDEMEGLDYGDEGL